MNSIMIFCGAPSVDCQNVDGSAYTIVRITRKCSSSAFIRKSWPTRSCRDPRSEAALGAAFEKGGWERVTRLYRQDDVPEDRAWVRAPGWCLAYA